MWLIILIIIVVVIFSRKKDNNKQQNNTQPAKPMNYMPVDPQKYVIQDGGLGKLVGYNGDEDDLLIPMGIRFVGDGYNPIRKDKVWNTVFIPKSVIKIDDCALPFVESVYYEGSAEEFARIDKGDIAGSNFMTGFVPNNAKNLPNQEHRKVKEVGYLYNVNIAEIYKHMEEKRMKNNQ